MQRFSFFRVFTLLLVLLIPQIASAAIFMLIPGVPGDVQANDYEGWIDVTSVSESISKPQTTVGGTRRNTIPLFSDIVVTKLLDKTSPELRKALATGKAYDTIKIHLLAAGGSEAGLQKYFEYELTDALITAVSLSGDGENRPAETVSIGFEAIKWIFTDRDNKGDVKGTVQAEYIIPVAN